MTADRRRPDRNRLLLFVLLAVAVVAIPGRLAWSMRSDALTKASDTRDEVQHLQDQIAQARRDQARTGELADQLAALGAALPADPDLPSVVEQLQALAKEANVTFSASSQTQPAAIKDTRTADDTAATTTATTARAGLATASDEEPAAVVTSSTTSFLIEVDIVGTRSNLTAYLEKIRALPRMLTVERLAWSWRDGTTGGANTQAVTAHFTVKAYSWAGAPKTTTAAAAPTTTVP